MEVTRCATDDEFITSATRWDRTAPFPVRSGPELRRYEAVLAAAGLRALPGPTLGSWAGRVVSVGGGVASACARLLAVATGRLHQPVEAGDIRRMIDDSDDALAIVGLAPDLERVGDWPATPDRSVGLVVARTTAALSALVYRTLTAECLDMAETFTLASPSFPDAAAADAVVLDELDELQRRHVGTFVINSHGRECSIYLVDGLICGRSDPAAPAALRGDPALRTTSCMRGEGCFRPELGPHQRLPAHRLNASLVFIDSCNAVAVGNNAFPTDLGIGLGFLSGIAVGVIGGLGDHIAHEMSRTWFFDRLDAGLPLGEVLRSLNERAYRIGGEQTVFGLLGDPGLTLRPRADRPSEPATRAIPVGASSVEGFPDVSPDRLAALQRVATIVLPRLERLGWLDVEVDAERLRLLKAELRRESDDNFRGRGFGSSATFDGMAALHEDTMGRLMTTVHDTWWKFEGSALSGLRQTSAELVECPSCGRERAHRLVAHHRVESDLVIRTLRCRGCGPLAWSTGDETSHSIHGEFLLSGRRGTDLTVNCTMTNHRPAETGGAVGIAFIAGKLQGLPPPTSMAVTLPAVGFRTHAVTVEIAPSPVPDEHAGVRAALFDGDLSVSAFTLTLT